MKSLLSLAVMALSLNAFAVNANSPWSEIFAARNVEVQMPQVSFLTNEATSLVSIDQVCFTQTTIQTIKPQTIYTHSNSNDNAGLNDAGKAILVTGRSFVRYLPGPNDRSDMTAVAEEIPLSYKLEVRGPSTANHDGRVLFTKIYNLPACN